MNDDEVCEVIRLLLKHIPEEPVYSTAVSHNLLYQMEGIPEQCRCETVTALLPRMTEGDKWTTAIMTLKFGWLNFDEDCLCDILRNLARSVIPMTKRYIASRMRRIDCRCEIKDILEENEPNPNVLRDIRHEFRRNPWLRECK